MHIPNHDRIQQSIDRMHNYWSTLYIVSTNHISLAIFGNIQFLESVFVSSADQLRRLQKIEAKAD